MNEVNAAIAAAIIGPAGTLMGVVLGWALPLFTDKWFGPKLKLECNNAPAHRTETEEEVYIRIRLQNIKTTIARSCRPYMIGVYEIKDGKVHGTNKLNDSIPLVWAGYTLDPRDIPKGVSQYFDVIKFSKHEKGWKFITEDKSYRSTHGLTGYKGIYRFECLVSAERAEPVTKSIDIEYADDWNQMRVWDTPRK